MLSETSQDPLIQNAQDLEQELVWFTQLLDIRFKAYFEPETVEQDIFTVTPPDFSESPSSYARFLAHYQPTFHKQWPANQPDLQQRV